MDYRNIMSSGIDLSQSRVDADFGRGFYTTTLLRQARHWAWGRYYALKLPQRKANQPVVVRFRFAREELASLESMQFVRGNYFALDFWSLVQHCRRSTKASPNDHQHTGAGRSGWYDMVVGPAASHWRQRSVIQGADQFSFHGDFITRANGLNAWINSGRVTVAMQPVV